MSGNFIGAQPYIQFGLEWAKALNWIRHDVLNDVLELAIHNLQIDSPEKNCRETSQLHWFLESQHQVS